MNPTVSVIIPTFNREYCIKRAINSVLAQTCTDFELIIVDDGSTDGTERCITSFDDKRIRYIRHPQARGASAARNTGMHEAFGKYLAFLDSDDMWHPQKLEKQLEIFLQSGEDLGFVYSGACRITRNRTEHILPQLRGKMIRHLLIHNHCGSASSMMISRKVIDDVGCWDETLYGRNDIDYWIRIAEKFNGDFVNEELVTIHSDATDRISLSKRKADAYFCLFRKHLPLLRKYRRCSEHARRAAKNVYDLTNDRSLALQLLNLAIKACPASPVAWFNYIRYWFKWR